MLARVRSILRSRLETAYAVAWKFGYRLAARKGTHRAIFTRIHDLREWGTGESLSGPGSTRARGEELQEALVALFERYSIATLLDAPCGDFNWMQFVLPATLESYVGVDVVDELIARNDALHAAPSRSFLCRDLTRDSLPRADLVLCRDAFIHFSYADIEAALSNFKRSGSTLLLTTSFAGLARNEDTRTGGWRPLNLEAEPFNFPPPLESIADTPHTGPSLGKSLCLWKLAEIP